MARSTEHSLRHIYSLLDAANDRISALASFHGARISALETAFAALPQEYPVVLTAYEESPVRFAEQDIHGALESIRTGDTLDSVTNVVFAKGTGKPLIAVNAGAVTTGTMTITGTSVDRDTGAETPADSEDIAVTGITTDASTTDAEGNAVHAFTDAYITTKWYRGTITVSTSDLDCTIDSKHISFEQWNDAVSVDLDTFDINCLTNHANARLYAYLYTVVVTTPKADITKVAELSIPAGDALNGQYFRLHRGGIGVTLDGTKDGVFCNLFLGPSSQTYFNDMTVKVWGQVTSTAPVMLASTPSAPTGDQGLPDFTEQ